MPANKVWLIIHNRTVSHEGDERSRNYPGHGYPAYSEEVQNVKIYTAYSEFEKDLIAATKSNRTVQAYEATPITTKIVVNVEIN